MGNQIECPECGNRWYVSGMKMNVYCYSCRTNVQIGAESYF